MDKFNTHQVTMGIKKSIKQQNSKQKRHIAPKSKEFRSWILRKVIDNARNNSLNIWILDNPKIWGTHLNRREVVMESKGWCCWWMNPREIPPRWFSNSFFNSFNLEISLPSFGGVMMDIFKINQSISVTNYVESPVTEQHLWPVIVI